MPDPPDKGRPSSPLSVEDADRLADSFTAFWEDAGAPDTSGPVAAPTPSPGTVTAPMPAVTVSRKPSGTLLGIAPINIEKPASVAPPPAAPASVAPPPAAVPAAAREVITQPMPVAAAAPLKRPSTAPTEGVQQSTPNVPGYAIAYTPKDPPSTPAVVIAPEAQSSPEHQPPQKKREFSQTMPSRVRSAPNASLAPVPLPTPATPSDDFNPYAPKKGKGKVIGLALGGALLVAVALVRTFGTGNHELPTQAASPHNDVVPVATVVPPPPTPTPAETARPIPSPAESSAAEPAPVAATIRRANEAPPAKAKAKPKAEFASAAARPVTRAPAPAPAPEPSPPPTRAASKGVIVRDAPF